MFSSETVIFFLSSVASLLLIYFKVGTTVLMQILAVLLLFLLLFINRRLPFSRSLSIANRSFRTILLFVSAFFIQLLVLSTGGFYSIFLILLHIYTLATSFLLNIRSSISFLIFSLFILVTHVLVNEQIHSLFQENTWALILFLTSFIVTIPIAQLLMRTYHIKDILSKSLAKTIEIAELREKSILQGLNELVLVTDRNLRILSANEAVERTLNILLSEIIGHPFFEVFSLQDKEGKNASISSLGIDQALHDKAARSVDGLSLVTKAIAPIKVSIQVRPIADLEGSINQIAFVIRGEGGKEHQLHSYLDQARMRHKALIENLANSPELRRRVELYSKIEDDLITALEVEDHIIHPAITHEDITQVARRVVFAKQNFAKSLGVALSFSKPEGTTTAVPISLFFVPVDAKWLDLLLRKVLDMAILLASKERNPAVAFMLGHTEDAVTITISASAPPLSQKDEASLFTQYYGEIGARTNLIAGSGLEGFIAKTIATQLHIPLRVVIENNRLTFLLRLS